MCRKRDLGMQQKRPVYATKETCVCGKRDLGMRQKRPRYAAKETWICGKRDLAMQRKRGNLMLERGRENMRKKRPSGKRDLNMRERRPIGKRDLNMRKRGPIYIQKNEEKPDAREGQGK